MHWICSFYWGETTVDSILGALKDKLAGGVLGACHLGLDAPWT